MLRLALALLSLHFFATHRAEADDELRLYVLDCGHAELEDGSAVSDTGEYEGRAIALADPCFLIRHPRGWLLWDAGLSPTTQSGPGFHVQSAPALVAQLAAIGIEPADVSLLAFSHLHFDHVGNVELFSAATFILNRAELGWAEEEPSHVSMVPALFRSYRKSTLRMVDGDHDVFGDGRVRIYHAPGHTPGSAVLWVDLAKHGPVMLSGDLYLTRESRQHAYVPTVNSDRADTLASMARVERLAKRTHARIVVQHDVRDFAALPKPPAFWN